VDYSTEGATLQVSTKNSITSLWGWIGRFLRRLLIPILYWRNDRNIFVPPFTKEELGVTAFDRVGCGSKGRIVAKIGAGHK
jgi:hypothetical protein